MFSANRTASLIDIRSCISTYIRLQPQITHWSSFPPSALSILVHWRCAKKTRHRPNTQSYLEASTVTWVRWLNTRTVADGSKKRCRNKLLHRPSLFELWFLLPIITPRDMSVIGSRQDWFSRFWTWIYRPPSCSLYIFAPAACDLFCRISRCGQLSLYFGLVIFCVWRSFGYIGCLAISKTFCLWWLCRYDFSCLHVWQR